MRPRHPPITLLLTLLSFLSPALGGGFPVAPDEQDDSCVMMFSSEVPERQEVLLDSYHYINLELQWADSDNQWDITSQGTCIATLAACSDSYTGGLLRSPHLNLDGATDPITVSVDYSCSECPMCNFSVTVSNTGTGNPDVTIFSCGETDADVQREFEFTPTPNQPRLDFEVNFSGGADPQRCVTLNRVRAYYYQQCPETIVALTNLPETMPGTLNNSTCVENAETDNILLAACSSTGAWVVDSEDYPILCNCSAGFEPNSNNTVCEACGDMEYKSSAGNFECAMCGDGSSGSLPDRTRCVCLPGYQGAGCTECAENYYSDPTEGCQSCPARSTRPLNSDESLCTCNEGYVISSGSTTTSGEACNRCAMNFYNTTSEGCQSCPPNSGRALSDDETSCTCNEGYLTSSDSDTTMGDACNKCEMDFYRPVASGGCQICPDFSGREQNADESSCTCQGGHVTNTNKTITTGDDCIACEANYYLSQSGDMCEVCPDYSARPFDPANQASCTCDTGYVTSSGDDTTMGDHCSRCAPGYGRFSTGDTETCFGIVVKFTQDTYLFNETSNNIFLTVVAEPPPEDSIFIDADKDSDEIQFITATIAPLSSDSPESDIVIRSPDDDIALEDQDSYTIAFIITGGDYFEARNTTTLLIDDTAQVTVGFSRESYTVSESAGKGEVRVELSAKVAKEVEMQITCRVSSRNNTEPSADSLKDCRKTLTFASGMRTQVFEFDINDDSKTGEDDEQYSLTLVLLKPNDDDRLTLSRTNTFVYIRDDDEEDEAEAFPLGAIIGVCAGGAVLAIMAALLCLLCLCVWRVNVNRQGFYPTYEDKEAAPSMLRYSASLRSISSQTVVVAEGKPATQKENEYFV